MKYIEKLKENNIKDSVITSWYFYDDFMTGLNIKGDLSQEEQKHSEYKHYDIYFSKIQGNITGDIKTDLPGKMLKRIEISKEELYYVELELLDNVIIKLNCKGFSCNFKHYRGTSYKNVYGTKEFTELFDKNRYVVCSKYFVKQEIYKLPDEYSLEVNSYADMSETVVKATMDKCILRHKAHIVYEYESIYNHVKPFEIFIEHNNGHHYYPFHIDLYGISYLELDTGKVYNYVPQGYDNDWGGVCGESFIITNIHYDINTNLIAYGGCYWGGPSEVMVGDFSEPLNFKPELFNVHELIDPEYEEIDDVDFVRWETDQLVVKADYEKEYEIEIKELDI